MRTKDEIMNQTVPTANTFQNSLLEVLIDIRDTLQKQHE